MAIKVGVNGFGRIGRLVVRAGIKNPDIEFVGVNDLTNADTLAHLFKYDSTFGIYPGTIKSEGGNLVIDGKIIKVTSERDPSKLPWKELGADIIVESTGIFRDAQKAGAHISAGAKKVIISAPGKGDGIFTVCMGINEKKYDPAKDHIISNASCTTNCLAPMVKVLHENFTVKNAFVTTIHSYTNDQPVLDFPHSDLRRSRAAAVSMIPTSTGAAKAIGLVMPELKGKLNGIAIRVPTQNVSLVDLTANLEKSVTKEKINEAMKKASGAELKGCLEFCDDPIVSRDVLGNPASCVFDSLITDVVEEKTVKLFGWYDNEWGYSSRTVDLILYLASKGL